jgi:hypothetical protein
MERFESGHRNAMIFRYIVVLFRNTTGAVEQADAGKIFPDDPTACLVTDCDRRQINKNGSASMKRCRKL